MGRVVGLISVALLVAQSSVTYAEDGDEHAARAGSLTAQAQTGAPDPANTGHALRITQSAPRNYDGNAIPAPNGFATRPASSTVRIIDSGALKLELRNDGQGHSALTSPLLKGAGVGGEVRRGGGVFRFSWPTSN